MIKKYLFISILLLVMSSCGFSLENPLLGKWRSDKERTIKLIQVSQVSEEAKQILINEVPFGEMVIEYSQGTLTSLYKGEISITSYRVKSVGGGVVKIEERDSESGEWITKEIEVGDGFIVVPATVVPDIREVFVRVE